MVAAILARGFYAITIELMGYCGVGGGVIARRCCAGGWLRASTSNRPGSRRKSVLSQKIAGFSP